MADCHNLFLEFNSKIRLTESRKQALLTARRDLRSRINNGFSLMKSQLPSVHEIQFQTQGSFVMDTIINPISEDYDLDDGVYFIGPYTRDKRGNPKSFHEFIIKSVEINNYKVNSIKDKDTCVRVLYKERFQYLFENKTNELQKGFHVDLPIYYSTTKKCPDLAHLKKSWITSDPIEFIEWFEKKANSGFKPEYLYEKRLFSEKYNLWKEDIRKQDTQLRRIVRYIKAWCDYQQNEQIDMPCGIILTILAAENYVSDSRDDISFNKTVIAIKNSLDEEFVCRRPTTPKAEDLLEGYNNEILFSSKLNSLVESAKQAINESNQKRSCGKWQFHFGDRFSCFNARDYDENAKSYAGSAIIHSSAKSA